MALPDIPLDLQLYLKSVPQNLRNKLDKTLDSEHGGVQRDLGTIADSMDEWEGKIAEQLQLTKPEIEAIKTEYPRKLHLQTRAALQKWQEKFGPMATYKNLIMIFVRAGKGDYAEAVCRVIRQSHAGQSSESTCPPPSNRQRTSSDCDPQTPIKQFAKYLKGVYKKFLASSSDKFPHLTCSKFIDLALVKKERVTRLEAEEFTKASLHGHIDEIIKKKKPIKLEEVLNPTEGQPDIACVLLEGAPGIGKSTCVGELCRRWDEIDALKKYSLVILVRLREKRVQEAQSVEGLCFHRNKELRQAVAAEIEACEGRDVLFVLDGFDELPASLQGESIFVELIQGTYLSHCTVLVTSRPSATADFQMLSTTQACKQIEVVGFTQKNIEEYASVIFAFNPDVLADFLTYISTNPAIRSMMYIPMNSAIVVEIYRNRSINTPIPQTMTQLYTEMSCILLKRHLGEDNPLAKKIPKNLENLPPQLYQPFSLLAKLAFEGLEREVFVFHELVNDFRHFGFMNSPTELYMGEKVSMSCSFLHLTLQEFLAAFHISQLSPSDQKSVFVKYARNYLGFSWNVVWRFVAGLTGFSGIGWEMAWSTVKTLLSGDVSNDHGDCIRDVFPFHIQCLFEAQGKVDYNSVLENKGEFQVTRFTSAAALDTYAVGYCIANTKCKWVLRVCGYNNVQAMEMLKYGLCSSKKSRPAQYVNIVALNFSDCYPNYNELADIIPLMTNLRDLNISSNPEDKGELVKLLQALSHLKHLEIFRMPHTAIGCSDLNNLSQLITLSSSLKELEIGDLFMSNECLELMLKATLSPSSLKTVIYWNVNWTDQAVKLLEENSNITELKQGYGSNGTSLTTVAEALCKNSHLKKLQIFSAIYPQDDESDTYMQRQEHEDPLREDEVSSLSEMLKQNTSLEYLEIYSYNCPLTRSQLMILNNALHFNNTLKALTIRHYYSHNWPNMEIAKPDLRLRIRLETMFSFFSCDLYLGISLPDLQ